MGLWRPLTIEALSHDCIIHSNSLGDSCWDLCHCPPTQYNCCHVRCREASMGVNKSGSSQSLGRPFPLFKSWHIYWRILRQQKKMQCLKSEPLESEEISADVNPVYRGLVSLGLSEGCSTSTTFLCCLQRHFKRSFSITLHDSQFLFLWQRTPKEQLEGGKANLASFSVFPSMVFWPASVGLGETEHHVREHVAQKKWLTSCRKE